MKLTRQQRILAAVYVTVAVVFAVAAVFNYAADKHPALIAVQAVASLSWVTTTVFSLKWWRQTNEANAQIADAQRRIREAQQRMEGYR